MTKKRVAKPFPEMSTRELTAATAEFDKEFAADTFGPLTPEMRARWEEAQRKSSRSGNSQRIARVISVSVEKELLARSDALARKLGITRAGLIARGLKAVLAAEGEI